eukprot:2893066-Pyramimonas_sp.AAC.1
MPFSDAVKRQTETARGPKDHDAGAPLHAPHGWRGDGVAQPLDGHDAGPRDGRHRQAARDAVP